MNGDDQRIIELEGQITLRNAELDEAYRSITRLTNELEKSQESLVERNLQLNKAAMLLEEKNSDTEEFTRIASHDLQAPLRRLTSFSEMLLKDLEEGNADRVAQDVAFISEATSKMRTLIQDILKLSRAGRSGLVHEWVSLDDCAREAIRALSAIIDEGGAEIAFTALPDAWCDRTMVTQLFQNLIENSLKFVPGGVCPRIRINAENSDDGWVIGVQDNGIGMEAQYAEKIFQPFKRLNAEKEYKGSGIGLSICRNIVGRLGGRIWVESEPGDGAHFRFTIPGQGE